ncbi:MAG: hypothetical protein AAGD11_16955 [Planctomycetota bacterium]
MSKIKQRLEAGKIARVMFFGSLATPKFVEAAAKFSNIHGVWFDQEH